MGCGYKGSVLDFNEKRLHWESVVCVAVCALDNNAEAGPPTLPLVPLPCYCAMQYTMG